MTIQRDSNLVMFAAGLVLVVLVWSGPSRALAVHIAEAASVANESEPPADADVAAPPNGLAPPGDRPLPPWPAPRGLRMWLRLNEQERDEILDILSEHFPERYDELLDLEQRDREMFGRQMSRILPEMMRLRDLRERDPEIYEIRLEELKNEFLLRRLALRYRFAKDEGRKSELEREIRARVEQQFGLREIRAEHEVARLERRLGQLKERLERHGARRAEHVERAVKEILAGDLPGEPRSEKPDLSDEHGQGPSLFSPPDAPNDPESRDR